MAHSGRIFRIFVSSTFHDLTNERNALQRHVFPRLQRLCHERGAKFQAIDLRWGIRVEASLDHRTMRLCLDEIAQCQKVTSRPNFLILLGDRYGACPLPEIIPEAEFARLLKQIAPDADRNLASSWYLLDNNAAPPERRLRARQVEQRPGQTAQEWEAQRRAEAESWPGLERRLRDILTTAAQRAVDAVAVLKYQRSATEQEIERGVMTVADAAEHVFGYFRSITNRDAMIRAARANPAERERIAQLVDLDEDGAPDPVSHDRLNALRRRLVEKISSNIRRYTTEWRASREFTASEDADRVASALLDALVERLHLWGEEVDDKAWEELQRLKIELLSSTAPPLADERLVLSPAHLPALCADVFLDLARTIFKEMARFAVMDEVEREAELHRKFGDERAAIFVGRGDIQKRVLAYLRDGPSAPLTVWGPSGSGKSALMARLAREARKQQPLLEVVERFIGASPASSARGLVLGVCQEIFRRYGAADDRFSAGNDGLAAAFKQSLTLASADRPLVVFFDALDHLTDRHDAEALEWLPAALPEHTRVIVSVSDGHRSRWLANKLGPAQMLELGLMPSSEAYALLDLWLGDARRVLQPDQRKEVLQKFELSGDAPRGGLPLYLKLAFEEACRWTSDDRPTLRVGVAGIVRDFFERLARNSNHGPMLVARSLAYIAGAKHGLAEDELIDILTMDKDVMADFEHRARHRPPERWLPIVVWSRLLFDLEPYLVERAADGAMLFTFFHRQLREVVETDYCSDDSGVERHRILTAYFESQALYFDPDARRRPNVRKLVELPFQQTCGAMWSALSHTLGRLEFVEAKCKGGMVGALVSDYALAGARMSTHRKEGLHEYKRALVNFSRHQTEETIACLKGDASLLPANVPLLNAPPRPPDPPAGRAMLSTAPRSPNRDDEVAAHIQEFGAFVSAHAHIIAQSPNDLLPLARNHTSEGEVAVQAEALLGARQGSWLAREPRPKQARVDRGRCVRTLVGHTAAVRAVSITADGETAISASDDKTLCVWKVDDGELVRTLQGHATPVLSVALSADGLVAVSGAKGLYREEGTWLANLNPPRLDTVTGMRYFLESSPWDGVLRVWNVETGEWSALCGPAGRPACIEASCAAITPDGSIAVSGGRNVKEDNRADFTLFVWDVAERTCLRCLEGHANRVTAVTISPDGRIVCSASEDGTVRRWDVQTGAATNIQTSPIGYFGVPSIVYGVGASADGRYTVSVGHDDGGSSESVSHWEVASDKVHRFREEKTLFYRAVALAPAGCWAVTATDKAICLWDVKRGECIQRLEEHLGDITSVALAPDACVALSGSEDKTLRVWTLHPDDSAPGGAWRDLLEALQSGVAHPTSVHHLAVSPDRRIVVSAGYDPFPLVWSLSKQTPIAIARGHGRFTKALAIAQDGRWVISKSEAKFAAWSAADGHVLHERTLPQFKDHKFIMTPDGRALVVHEANDARVHLVDVESFRHLRTLLPHFSSVSHVELSPDGAKVVSAGRDKQICIHDLRTGCLALCYLDHAEEIVDLTLTPDGRGVASASKDKSIHLWEVESGRIVHIFEGHKEAPCSLAFTPDGRTIVSCCQNDGVRIWDVKSGACRRSFDHVRGASGVVPAPDGRTCLVLNGRDLVQILDLDTGDVIATYYAGGTISAHTPMLFDGTFVCATDNRGLHFLSLRGRRPSAPILTFGRLFRISATDRCVGQIAETACYGEAETMPGEYDDELSAICPKCGAQVAPTARLASALLEFVVADGELPCVALSNEAWADERLRFACPRCEQGLQANPFTHGRACTLGVARAETSEDARRIRYLEGKAARQFADAGQLYELAVYYGKQGHWDKSVATFSAGLARKPGSPFCTTFALALLEVGDIDQALVRATTAVELAQSAAAKDRELHESLSSAFRLEPDTKEPRRNERTKELSAAYLARAMALEKLGRTKEAADAYANAAATHDSPDAYFMMGAMYAREHRYKEAFAAYEDVLRIDPHYEFAHSNMGYVLQEQEQHDRAIVHFTTATEIAPTDPIAWYDLGDALKRRGDDPEAIRCLEESFKLDPTSYKTAMNLARLYEKTEQWAKCTDFYTVVRQLTENDGARSNRHG